MKSCVICGEQISDIAKKCRYCGSYQKFWSFSNLFYTFSTTLSMILALSSILVLTAPTAYKLFHTPRSKLTITPISIDDAQIELIVSNSGDIAAVITLAKIDNGNTTIQFKGKDKIVKSGQTIIYTVPTRQHLLWLMPWADPKKFNDIKNPCKVYVDYLDAESSDREASADYACLSDEWNKKY